jgi:hypothetical protein
MCWWPWRGLDFALSKFRVVFLLMELSVVVEDPKSLVPKPHAISHAEDACSSDVVSMRFTTPTSIMIRRPSCSPRVDFSEKKKWIVFDVGAAEERAEIVDALDPAVVVLPSSEIRMPDVTEILDPGYILDPYHLGISAYFRSKKVNLKPSIDSLSDLPSTALTNSDILLRVDMDSIPHVAHPCSADLMETDLVDPPPGEQNVPPDDRNMTSNQPSLLPDDLELFPDDAFNHFVSSLPDCEQCDSDGEDQEVNDFNGLERDGDQPTY